MRLRIFSAILTISAALPVVPHLQASGPAISIAPASSQVCYPFDPSRCGYPVTPGSVIVVSGSGFSLADTSVTLSGIPSDQDSTMTCPAAGGSFSCTFVMPDVPGEDVPNSVQAGITFKFVNWMATGTPAQDTAQISLEFQPGVGIWPTSGPPGSTVRVYGNGYYGDGTESSNKGGVAESAFPDSATVVTVGPDYPSNSHGSGPAVLYVGANSPKGVPCIPSIDGSLSDNGPCTFTVPGFLNGTYNVGISVLQIGFIPDTLVCNSAWCVTQFTITGPSVDSVTPLEARPGDTLLVKASGFAATDRTALILVDGVPSTPSSGCSIATSSAGGSLSCSFVVPSTATAPGPHSVYIVGVEYGDHGSGQFVAPGNYPLSLSATQAPPAATVTVNGIAFDAQDTSVRLLLGGTDVTPAAGCPVSSGAFNCSFTVPNVIHALYQLQATGNKVGDYVLADFTVVGSLALNPSEGAVGTSVAISGIAFGFTDSNVKVTFNSLSLPLVLKYPDVVINGVVIVPGQKITGPTCPAENGTFTLTGYTCSFTIPASALVGANSITVADDTGASASAVFQLVTSVVLSQTQASKGTAIAVTGYGFPQTNNVTLTLAGILVNNPSACSATADGKLSCAFTVPDVVPGNYTIVASAAGQTLATAPFAVVPSLTLGSGGGFPGSTVSLQAGGYSRQDTGFVLSLNNISLTPACSLIAAPSSPTESFSCTFIVPQTPAGAYVLKAVGNVAGDLATTTFNVLGISLSPLSGAPYLEVEAKGVGFSVSDTSVSLSVGGVPVSPFDRIKLNFGCSVVGGMFDCSFTVPPIAGGVQPVVATGNTGDSGNTVFTVFPRVDVVSPLYGQAPAGSQVTVNGAGFLPANTSIAVSFAGQSLNACPTGGGVFTCTFKVPSVVPGSYTVTFTGNSGAATDIVMLTLDVTPGITLSPPSGVIGQTVNVTGTNFAAADTSATLSFYLGNASDNSVAVGPPAGCPVVNGSLASCSFIVPNQLPSGLVNSGGDYGVLAAGNSGDQATAPFSVTGSTVPDFTVFPASAPIGSTVTVSGGRFLSSDTKATLTFGHQGSLVSGTVVSPPSGCPIVNGTIPPCSFTVPAQVPEGATLDSSHTGFLYVVTASGDSADQLTAPFSPQETLVVAPTTILPGENIAVSGVGYPCLIAGISQPCDGSDPFIFGVEFPANPNLGVLVTQNCSVANGAFSCSLTLRNFSGQPLSPGNYLLDIVPPSSSRIQVPFAIVEPDTTPPMLNLPGDITVTTSSVSGQAVTFTVTASDAVDGPVVPVCLPASGSIFPIGKTKVTCTATDSQNNKATGSFNVTVQGAPVGVTVGASPAGLAFTVDSVNYSSTQTFTWVVGSSHTLSTPSPQTGPGTQYVFSVWSDGMAQSHPITVVSSTTSYTASFTARYQLLTAVSPVSSGAVSPLSGGYYDSGTPVNLSASPGAGFAFTGWSGPAASPSSSSTTVTMTGPVTVTASFSATVHLTTIITLTHQANGTYQAAVKVTNSGGGPALNVALVSMLLNTAAGTPASETLGDIPPNGGSLTALVSFPASVGSPGAAIVERYSGTYSGGTFSGSLRATLPQ